MKRVTNSIFLVFVLVAITIIAVGCNTIEGAGKDIERGGEKIQDVAD